MCHLSKGKRDCQAKRGSWLRGGRRGKCRRVKVGLKSQNRTVSRDAHPGKAIGQPTRRKTGKGISECETRPFKQRNVPDS